MKNGMLHPVRRNVKLDDEFFYYNGQECANFKYKSNIKEEKVQGTIGYWPKTKSTWVEARSAQYAPTLSLLHIKLASLGNS